MTDNESHTRAGPGEQVLLGLVCMLAGVSVVPLMDAVAKGLSDDHSVLQIVWARFTFHLLWVLPVIFWLGHGRALLQTRPLLQILRGGFLLAATLCYFSAIARMPIADALALLFISPMVTTLLAPLVLHEHVGWWRRSAVLVGFAGVLIVVRPGSGVFQWASLLALAAGGFHGCYLLTTRRLAGSTTPLVTLFYTALPGAVAMSFIAPGVWTAPSALDWGLMIAMGAFAAAGHGLIILAFNRASASVVAPVAYAEIVTATAVGYVFFGHFPAAWTWLGIVVIIASGMAISLRENRLRSVQSVKQGIDP